MLTTLKIELLETACKHVSINMLAAKSIQNELMDEQNSTLGARGVNPSTGHKSIVRVCREKMKSTVRS